MIYVHRGKEWWKALSYETGKVDGMNVNMYNVGSFIQNGGEVVKLSASEIIKKCLAIRGCSMAELGRRLNCTGQNISLKLKRNSISANEFMMWLDMLGYEVIVKERDGYILDENTELPKKACRIRCVVDGVRFDSLKAKLIAKACEAEKQDDDEGKATELYEDNAGNMFFVERKSGTNGKDTVVLVPRQAGEAFLEKYRV